MCLLQQPGMFSYIESMREGKRPIKMKFTLVWMCDSEGLTHRDVQSETGIVGIGCAQQRCWIHTPTMIKRARGKAKLSTVYTAEERGADKSAHPPPQNAENAARVSPPPLPQPTHRGSHRAPSVPRSTMRARPFLLEALCCAVLCCAG